MPDFELEDIEDYYTFYVLILHISEDLFWNADISFVRAVSNDKAAFDNYMNVKTEEYYDKIKKR